MHDLPGFSYFLDNGFEFLYVTLQMNQFFWKKQLMFFTKDLGFVEIPDNILHFPRKKRKYCLKKSKFEFGLAFFMESQIFLTEGQCPAS